MIDSDWRRILGAHAPPLAALLRRPVRILFRKELRQFLRSRTAILTGLLLPALVMVVAPVVQLAASTGAPAARSTPAIPASVPGLAGMAQLSDVFLYFTLPLFFVLGGLMTPSLAATHTVISERERRSIELLVALPVSVTDILTAKMAANLTVAAATLLPLFLVDAVAVLTLTHAGLLYLMAALVLLLSSLVASIGISLLLALVARDFRTANNLNGVFVVPAMILTGICVTLVPGLWRFLVLALLMLGLGAIAYLIAKRWLTFERYLS
jgi:ABC-type Na+ efflux pump permease subunit